MHIFTFELILVVWFNYAFEAINEFESSAAMAVSSLLLLNWWQIKWRSSQNIKEIILCYHPDPSLG